MPHRPEASHDSTSTKVTQQRALTTSTGTNWLVIGGILAIICAGLLFAMQSLEAALAATVGYLVVIVLYVVMVVVRFAIAPGRRRLGTLAVLTILIPITFFACGGIVTAAEWRIGVS